MTTYADVLAAVLSLDTYNRGYNPELNFAANSEASGTAIGDATVIQSETNPNTSFYAVAYEWQGETIIAYRGTVFAGSPDLGDVLNGWTLSGGYDGAAQAQLALDFYATIANEHLQTNGVPNDLLLTGHSLGGGLAGFVADVTGTPATIFDDIPFGSAVVADILALDHAQGMGSYYYALLNGGRDPVTGKQYQTVPGSSADIAQFIVFGEVATGLRAASFGISQGLFMAETADPVLAAIMAARGAILDNTVNSTTLQSYAGLGSSPIDLHGQALMTLLTYADWQQDTAWQSIGVDLNLALGNAQVADALGGQQLNGGGWGTAVAALDSMIAYSALGSGVTPFGKEAIVSLFTDADSLGQIVANQELTGLLAGPAGSVATTAISEIIVQHAGDQAAFAGAHIGTDESDGSGILSLASSPGLLTIDLDPAQWQTTDKVGGADQIVGVRDLIDAIVTNATGIEPGPVGGAGDAFNAIDTFVVGNAPSLIEVALTAGATLTASGAASSFGQSTANAVLVAEDGSGTITAGDANTLIVGGATVTVGNGNNMIIGSEQGGETFTLGGGSNLLIAQGANNTINIDGGGTGISYVYAGTGGDTIDFQVGKNQVGFVILPVQNFSIAAALDLDRTALTAAINGDPSVTGPLFGFETGAAQGAGLNGLDWTILLVPAGLPIADNYFINGALPAFSPGNTYRLQDYPPLSMGSIIDTTYDGSFFTQDTMLGPASAYNLLDYLTTSGPPAILPSNGGSSAGAGMPSTVTNFSANQAALDATQGGFTVADTAAAVAAKFDALSADHHIDAIKLTDGGTPTLTLTAAQTVNDATARADITNTAYAISVTDTAANLAANFDALNADPFVSALAASDPGTAVLPLTVAMVAGDSRALGLLADASYTIAVSDTAANASAALDALDANSRITAITLTDPGTPTLQLSATQALGDGRALGAITNNAYAVAILDTAATIVADSASLGQNTHVASIAVSDTIGNYLANAAALDADPRVTVIAVNDTATNVLAASGTLAADPKVASIEAVDTAANILADAAALNAVAGVKSVVVADTAANVAVALDALDADGAVSWIALTDAGTPTLTLTAAGATGDTAALQKIINGAYNVDVVDTAANVSAHFDALNRSSVVHSLTLTDAGTPTLALTAGQALNDTVALSKIGNAGFGVAVTDTAASVLGEAAALAIDVRVTSVSVADTAGNVSTRFDALDADGAIKAITLTDSGTPVLLLTATEAANDTVALGKITNAHYVVDIIGGTPVTIALADDSGVSATDLITKDPTLAGTAAANATVTLTEGATTLGTVQTGVTGSWSFAPVGLVDGSQTIVANEAGPLGSGSASLGFTLDTAPPVVAVTSAGSLTNQANQTISGTVVALPGEAVVGATVSLFDNGAAIGSAMVGTGGAWSTTITLPTLGLNSLTASDTDAAGNVGTSSAVAYTLVAGPQVMVRQSTEVTKAGATVAFASADPITVADPSLAATGTITVTIADSFGTLHASKVAGAGAASTVAGSGTSTVTISGTLGAVNADLATLTYRDAAPGLDTITLAAIDQSHFAASPVSLAITVDDAILPVTHVPGSQTITVGSVLGFAPGGITVTEPNATAIGKTFTVAVGDTSGVLVAAAPSGGSVSGSGSNAITLTGTLSEVNADLASLTYTNHAPTGATPDSITIATKDYFGPAVDSAVVKSIAVNVDDIPVTNLTGPVAYGLDAGETIAISGVSLSSASLPDEIFKAVVSDTTGHLFATGGGIAGNGTHKLTLTGTLAQVEGDLAGLTYQAAAGATITSDTISVVMSDKTATATVSPTIHLTIDPLPVITSDGGHAAASVFINASQGTQPFATVLANELDPNDALSKYGIVAGAGLVTANASLSINPVTGVLAFAGGPVAGSSSVTVGALDANGGIGSQALTVQVTTNGIMTSTVGVADTFVFKPGFGADVVQNFQLTGGNHGILELDHGLFTGATTGESGAALLALLTSHSVQSGTDTVIHTDASGTIDLAHVARTTLLANLADIHLA